MRANCNPTMKEGMKPHTCKPTTSSTALTLREESHTISNLKPKIRIIHIFAPEIIKTDAANFRELVQSLTGKPERRKGGKKASKKVMTATNDAMLQSRCYKPEEATESCGGCQDSGSSERIKGVEEMWGEENSTFFGGLGDLDGFMQGLCDFPLVPLNSSCFDAFGEGRDASFPV
ncbi:hypothetical protein MRB53_012390 [Persea americana]|uniref:Uncharacterized protein n=1 Tax=Persea americana TaxID=3435 RepID=A0ACC2LXM2_PERAE|nr:hypothetical protein MRB53_012390 [Persea americana]